MSMTNKPSGNGRAFSAHLMQLREAIAHRFELTTADMKCLDIINTSSEISPGQIAERTQLSNSAVTGIIDRLEQVGLVQRAHHVTDRRRIIVRAVDMDKQREIDRLFAELDTRIGALMQSYSPAEQQLIGDYMRRVAQVVAALVKDIRENRV